MNGFKKNQSPGVGKRLPQMFRKTSTSQKKTLPLSNFVFT